MKKLLIFSIMFMTWVLSACLFLIYILLMLNDWVITIDANSVGEGWWEFGVIGAIVLAGLGAIIKWYKDLWEGK